MDKDQLEEIRLFFDLCADEVIENSMECLDAASIVSMQLDSAGIEHRFIRGSVTHTSCGSSYTLVPHFFVEVKVHGEIIIIDTALAHWFPSEVDDGLPLAFLGRTSAIDYQLNYQEQSADMVDRAECAFLRSIADRHPIASSLLK